MQTMRNERKTNAILKIHQSTEKKEESRLISTLDKMFKS